MDHRDSNSLMAKLKCTKTSRRAIYQTMLLDCRRYSRPDPEFIATSTYGWHFDSNVT
jgi:hypothetical protein